MFVQECHLHNVNRRLYIEHCLDNGNNNNKQIITVELDCCAIERLKKHTEKIRAICNHGNERWKNLNCALEHSASGGNAFSKQGKHMLFSQ